jgi:hypothetical protein
VRKSFQTVSLGSQVNKGMKEGRGVLEGMGCAGSGLRRRSEGLVPHLTLPHLRRRRNLHGVYWSVLSPDCYLIAHPHNDCRPHREVCEQHQTRRVILQM